MLIPCLAALLLAPASAQTGSPLPTVPPTVVPMDLRWQKPAIQVKLNGTGPYWLLLDSGAGPHLIVDSDLAAALQLPVEGKGKVGDPSHSHALDVDQVSVDRVEIGDLSYEAVEALSWDRPLYSADDRPRGVVGLGLFGGMLVTFDYPAGKVRLERGDLPEPDGVTVLKAPVAHNIPSVEIDVAGERLMARLDTGSTGFLTLPPGLAKQLPLAGEPVEVGRAHTVNGQYPVLSATLQGEVRLGGLRIERPTLHFTESIGANVGSELLRALTVTIDKRNERVRLVSDGRPISSSGRPRIGLLSAGVREGRMEIDGVAPGSPAEKAGLRAGDAILKINGEPVAPMKPGDVAMALRASPLRLTLLRDGREIEVSVELPPEGP